jgi:hypothetical protein
LGSHVSSENDVSRLDWESSADNSCGEPPKSSSAANGAPTYGLLPRLKSKLAALRGFARGAGTALFPAMRSAAL